MFPPKIIETYSQELEQKSHEAPSSWMMQPHQDTALLSKQKQMMSVIQHPTQCTKRYTPFSLISMLAWRVEASVVKSHSDIFHVTVKLQLMSTGLNQLQPVHTGWNSPQAKRQQPKSHTCMWPPVLLLGQSFISWWTPSRVTPTAGRTASWTASEWHNRVI